jgi:hypothetical protein
MDLSGVAFGFFTISGILLGGLSTLVIYSPSPEIDVDNNEILSKKDILIENKKLLKLSGAFFDDKFGTIKSIHYDYVILNEEPGMINITNIKSITDLESIVKRDNARRIKWATFTFFSGLGFGLGVTFLNSNDSQGALITGIIMGTCLVGAEILILTSRTDDEKEWEKYDQNKLGKSNDNGMNLSLGLGLLNLGAIHTAANVVYTNISPCITAKLCF